MARKKNDAGGAIIIVAIVILILIALATPIVILIGYLYNSIKAGEIKKKLSGEMSDFWLNVQEKLDFKEKVAQLVQVNEMLEQANRKGEDEGVSRNQDGSFSARSKLGKELKATIAKYEPIKNSISNYLYELQMLPANRWAEFNNYVKNGNAFMWSFCCWIGALVYYSITLGKQSVSEAIMPYLALATNFFRDEGSQLQMVDGDLQMVSVATVVAIASYFIFGMIFGNPAEKHTPKPEKVSLENIDSY